MTQENDFISEPVYLHWAYLGEPSLHSAVINARASFSFHLLHFSCKVPPKHVLTRTKRPGPNMRDLGKPSGRESSELSSQIISSKFASNKNDCKHSSVMLVLISYQSAPHGLVNTTQLINVIIKQSTDILLNGKDMEEKTDSEQPQTSAKMSAGDMAHTVICS